MHHRSYFLPKLERDEHDEFKTTLSESFGHLVVPLGNHGIYPEGNMVNISPTISINIFWTPSKEEKIDIGAYCLLEDI